jgi:hypothetical protein
MSANTVSSKNEFDAKKLTLEELTAEIDEAVLESFPASDPPAFTGTTASPSVNRTTQQSAIVPARPK